MTQNAPKTDTTAEAAVDIPVRILSPEAQRALAEAAERRAAADKVQTAPVAEIGGRSGPEPVRYGDWEKGGIAWDF